MSAVQNYLDAEIMWQPGPDPSSPYQADFAGAQLLVRLNDFPDDHLYTLIVNSREVAHFDDWPPYWNRRSSVKESSPQGAVVHKLKAKDSTGHWACYFVLVEPLLEQTFLKMQESQKAIDLEKYGKVIASYYEEEPNEQVKALLKEKYGFIAG
ncbi:MAG: hypothetical protein EXR78_04520 [Deltaproteobacteria bacterium]|nr:hypothetical protein [Deltaproteobacteria bacterium]